MSLTANTITLTHAELAQIIANAVAAAMGAKRPMTPAEKQRAYRDRRKTVTDVAGKVTSSGESVTSVTGKVTKPSPPPLPPAPPNPAPTPVRETRSRMREPESESESVRALESAIAAYPKNGNAMEARRALALLNLTVPELQAIQEKTAVLAARIAALPESERRYCPAKHTFFQERRWDDDPHGTPWTVVAATHPSSQANGNHSRAGRPPVTRNVEPLPANRPSLNATAVNATGKTGLAASPGSDPDRDGKSLW